MVDEVREGSLAERNGVIEHTSPIINPVVRELSLAFESSEKTQVDKGVQLALEMLNNISLANRRKNFYSAMEPYLEKHDWLAEGSIAKDVSGRSKGVLEAVLSHYLLDPDKIRNDWLKGIPGDRMPELITENLFTIAQLERIRPGICNSLNNNFGISNFARYPQELLVEQYDAENKKDDMPYGVVINAKDDSSGSFYQRSKVYSHLFGQLRDRYRVRIWEIEDQYGFVHALNVSRNTYGQISFAIVGGHGEKDSIDFGGLTIKGAFGAFGMFDNKGISMEDAQRKGALALKRAFIKNPTIVLSSCSTGDLGGVGQEISKIGGKVIAPPVDTYPESIDPIFLEDGGIDLKVVYHGTKTNVYNMGEPQG